MEKASDLSLDRYFITRWTPRDTVFLPEESRSFTLSWRSGQRRKTNTVRYEAVNDVLNEFQVWDR